MNQDLFGDRHHPTLLRIPTWYSHQAYEEIELPLQPGDYKVTPNAEGHWKVSTLRGDVVYEGIGPVEVRRSPAPF